MNIHGVVTSLFTRKNVPLEDISLEDTVVKRREGLSGKSLGLWPVYRFFDRYFNENQKEQAVDEYSKWYEAQLFKYGTISKKEGGLYKGSLYKLVEEFHFKEEENFDLLNGIYIPEIIRKAVRARVLQRFSLLDRLHINGYVSYKADPIIVLKKGKTLYLYGVHHRAACLMVLGYKEIPELVVIPNDLGLFLFRLSRKLDRMLSQRNSVGPAGYPG